MAEAWVNIEDNEDMINEIIDDDLILVDAIDNDENLDDADKEEEEEVLLETSTVKETAHKDVLGAFATIESYLAEIICQKNINFFFATIESYLAENKLPKEYQLSISKVRYRVQTHRIHKPKKLPTVRHFFDTRKPN